MGPSRLKPAMVVAIITSLDSGLEMEAATKTTGIGLGTTTDRRLVLPQVVSMPPRTSA